MANANIRALRPQIEALAAEGKSRPEIAELLGVTRNSLWRATRDWGMKFREARGAGPGLDDAQVEAAKTEYANGKTVQEIADLFGTCKSTVAKRLKEIGVQVRGAGSKIKQHDKLLVRAIVALADELNSTPEAVLSRLNSLRVMGRFGSRRWRKSQ